MNHHIKAVIFDCDGVMFDTARANRIYYDNVLAHFGLPPMNEQQFTFTHMHTADAAIAHLFPQEQAFAAAQAFRKTLSYRSFLKYMALEPGLKALLNRLRPLYKTAVATNRADSIGPLLEVFELSHLFDKVVCTLDVMHPKPHPDLLLEVLERLRIGPQQAVFIGDSMLDEQAAAAAGVPFIAYRNPRLTARSHIDHLRFLETHLTQTDS